MVGDMWKVLQNICKVVLVWVGPLSVNVGKQPISYLDALGLLLTAFVSECGSYLVTLGLGARPHTRCSLQPEWINVFLKLTTPHQHFVDSDWKSSMSISLLRMDSSTAHHKGIWQLHLCSHRYHFYRNV